MTQDAHSADAVREQDAALARAISRGSSEALGSLFELYAADLHRLAYRITGTTEDADDVLQDVFVGLRVALDRYSEQGRFLSWLRKVTAHTSLMRVRRRKRSTWEPLAVVDEAVAAASDRTVDRIAVRDALAEMPESNRLVFVLKDLEGYSHAEIADLLHISPAASRVRAYRAWRFLKDRVGGGA